MTYILGIITGILLSLIATVVSLFASSKGYTADSLDKFIKPKASIFIPPEPNTEEERLYDLLHTEDSP